MQWLKKGQRMRHLCLSQPYVCKKSKFHQILSHYKICTWKQVTSAQLMSFIQIIQNKQTNISQNIWIHLLTVRAKQQIQTCRMMNYLFHWDLMKKTGKEQHLTSSWVMQEQLIRTTYLQKNPSTKQTSQAGVSVESCFLHRSHKIYSLHLNIQGEIALYFPIVRLARPDKIKMYC